MRSLFRDYCSQHIQEFELFFPESAMVDYFSSPDPSPFDIVDFEKIVGELSLAIVIFPEAAGSYAETGYFSSINDLSSKTLLALDSKYQSSDSFISMGPARKIDERSLYSPRVQFNYDNPDFSIIIEKIKSRNTSTKRKFLELKEFSDLTAYELFCLIQKIVSLLSISTFENIIFIMRALFKSHISEKKVKIITSILVGVGYINEVSGYGHYATSTHKPILLEARDGFVRQESDMYLNLLGVYQKYEEFMDILEVARDAS
jgi:hypothetical protein